MPRPMMSIISILLILSAIVLNTSAQLLLKAGTNVLGAAQSTTWAAALWRAGTEWHILSGLIAYCVSFGVWLMALSRVQVSVAYPMLSLGYVINTFAARALFGEPLSLSKMAGVGFVLLGVCLIALNQTR